MEDSTNSISNGIYDHNISNNYNRDINYPKVYVEPCKIDFFNDKYNSCYPMYKNPRGQCLIMNIYQINGMPPRRWSDRDTYALKELFEQLLFKVTVYTDSTHDLNRENFIKIIKEFSSIDEHKDAQCSIVCLMSHGEEGYLTTKEGDKVLLDDIFFMFNNKNCPNLAGKPKLFFIQSCRDDPITGPAEDLGIHLRFNNSEKIDYLQKDEKDGGLLNNPLAYSDNNRTDSKIASEINFNNPKSLYHVPSLCDMLIGFPTQKGFIAYRKPEIGSWYMNAIVQIFSKHSHDTDLCAMLNMVNSLISGEVTNTGKKQMSEYTSKLTKPYFYFFPGLANEENENNHADKNNIYNDHSNRENEENINNCMNKKIKSDDLNYLSSNEQSDTNTAKFYKDITCKNNIIEKKINKLNQEHVEFISYKARNYWKYLARELHFTESEIAEIDKHPYIHNSNNFKLKYLLNQWILKQNVSKNEKNLSIISVLNILTNCRLNKIKDEFLKKFLI